MTRWIRWKGFVAFAAAVIVITLVWVLVVDVVVRRGVEYVGTRIVGARVDVADADLSLFPTGLELTGLAVTNPDAPMQNAVEIGRMKMDLDPGYLIRRKVIIGDLLVEGMRFGTPRRQSGEVPALARRRAERKKRDAAAVSKAAVEKVCGEFSMPSLSTPDVKAILAKEAPASVQQAQDLEKKIEKDKAYWEKEIDRLADEKTLADYRARIEKVKGAAGSLGSILGAAGDVQQLQADIRKDLSLLEKAKTTLTEDLNDYRQQINVLSQAPLADAKRLIEKYSLTSAGLGNLSELIFGARLCGWMGTVTEWYGKIRPYLDKIPKGKAGEPVEQEPLRGKGINVRFAESPPMPDFLIRRMKVSADLAAGSFSGKGENITLDQHILGSPATYAFLGKNMPHIDALSLIGSADYVNPAEPKNDARLELKGLGLANLTLIRQPALPLTIEHAMGNLNLDLSTVGNMLDATIKANFNSVQFVSTGSEEKPPIANAIASALTGVDRFSLTAGVDGTLDAYTVDVQSNLDNVLKSAVGSLVSAESAELRTALKERISDRLEGPMAQARNSLAGLDAIEAELSKRLNLGDELVKGLKLPF